MQNHSYKISLENAKIVYEQFFDEQNTPSIQPQKAELTLKQLLDEVNSRLPTDSKPTRSLADGCMELIVAFIIIPLLILGFALAGLLVHTYISDSLKPVFFTALILVGIYAIKRFLTRHKENKEKEVTRERAWQEKEAQARTFISYHLDKEASDRFASIQNAIENLRQSQMLWEITGSETVVNSKWNSGASSTIKRKRVKAGFGTPDYFQTDISIPHLVLGEKSLYFFPDALLIKQKTYRAIYYPSLKISVSDTRFIEEGKCPSDAELLGHTWKWTNKNGKPDLRYKKNYQIPIFSYGVLEITSAAGFNFKLMASNKNATSFFEKTLFGEANHSKNQGKSQNSGRNNNNFSTPENFAQKSPSEILHVSANATLDEINSAYRKMAQMYHPDKVASLGPELQALAEQRMKEINWAYAQLKNKNI